MFIQTEETPNPSTMKFIPGEDVMGNSNKTIYFKDSNEAQSSPLALSLFDIEGVVGVFFGYDFLTITVGGKEWKNIKPSILSVIMNHFISGDKILLEEKVKPTESVNLDDISEKIKDIIETHVRPAVAQDGGDIVFESYKDGIVYVSMKGSCDGCPSSAMTLKNGVENLLKHYIPEVQGVSI
jgi:Fe-S cluster biogenesis protein NfuA